MLIARMVGASAVIALSSLSAFGQSAQIAAVSGRDQLALHDLAKPQVLCHAVFGVHQPSVTF